MSVVIDQIIDQKGPGWHFYKRAKEIKHFEFASSAIHQILLQQDFPFPDYTVIGEQSPNDKSRRRIDAVVSYHEPEYNETTTLILCEFKREEKHVKEVEDQVSSAAKIWLQKYEGAQVYAYTTTGVSARAWYVNKDKHCRLEPLFGGQKGEKKEYVDIAGNSSHLILNSFAYMRGEIDYQDITHRPSGGGDDQGGNAAYAPPAATGGYDMQGVATTRYDFTDFGGPSGT